MMINWPGFTQLCKNHHWLESIDFKRCPRAASAAVVRRRETPEREETDRMLLRKTQTMCTRIEKCTNQWIETTLVLLLPGASIGSVINYSIAIFLFLRHQTNSLYIFLSPAFANYFLMKATNKSIRRSRSISTSSDANMISARLCLGPNRFSRVIQNAGRRRSKR